MNRQGVKPDTKQDKTKTTAVKIHNSANQQTILSLNIIRVDALLSQEKKLESKIGVNTLQIYITSKINLEIL